MNTALSELFKHVPLFLIVLGAVLLLVAALGGLPIGSQTFPVMDPVWRCILAGSGAVPLIIGIVLVVREYIQSNSKKEVKKIEGTVPESVLEPTSARQLAKSGLKNAFRIPGDNPRRLERVCELIRQEVEEGNGTLRLAASSGFSYLSPIGPVWTGAGLGKLITSGAVRMTIVLESPFSHFAITRALANRVFHHQWKEKMGVDNLIRLLQYPNVSVRVTEVGVNCSLFFTSRAVYYDPYLWALPHSLARTENKFWVFEFDKVKDPCDCYTFLEKHFDFLVCHSVPLEEVLHAPKGRTPLPRGKDFYYLYRENPEVALNRYEALTEEFRQNVRAQLKAGGVEKS
jgi:hypothetical protein